MDIGKETNKTLKSYHQDSFTPSRDQHLEQFCDLSQVFLQVYKHFQSI